MTGTGGAVPGGPVRVETVRVRERGVLNLRPNETVIYAATSHHQQEGIWHTFLVLVPFPAASESTS